MENKEVNLLDVNRVEIINHGDNKYPYGNFLSIHTKSVSRFSQVKTLEFSVQDEGKTLKIFMK